jgi:hypothetical protein
LLRIVETQYATENAATFYSQKVKCRRLEGVKIPRYIRAVNLLVGLVLGAVLLATCLFSPSEDPPSDEQMIERYVQNEAEFNQLAEMLVSEERLVAVFPDSGKCQIAQQQMVKAGSDARCAELVELFRQLDLGWAHCGYDPLTLAVFHSGLGVSGVSKGYVYASKPQQFKRDFVESTEASCETYPCYRQINTNWYIYLDD